MRTRWPVLFVVAFVGCGDDGGSPPPVDASSLSDAPLGIDGGATDAPPIDGGAACTGAAYDPCTSPSDCDSNNCHLFQQAGIQVCTQACNAGTPCPTQNGQAVQCNNMGICRPNAENACTP